jgi:hypothetical protein
MKSLKSCLLVLPWFASPSTLWRCAQIKNARRRVILIVGVIYGSGTGLDATKPLPNQFWHQDSPGILGTPADQDAFGAALAAGDFNNDGFLTCHWRAG